jgi:hypothetical protein
MVWFRRNLLLGVMLPNAIRAFTYDPGILNSDGSIQIIETSKPAIGVGEQIYAETTVDILANSTPAGEFLPNSLSLAFWYSLLIISLSLLICTEWKYQRAVGFIESMLWSVKESTSDLRKGNEGQLMYVTGQLQTMTPVYLTDPTLPIVAVSDALLLKRNVEMFQWVETKAARFGSVVYKAEWLPASVNSAKFKQPFEHFNPQWSEQLKKATFYFEHDIYLAPYRLTKEIMKKIPIRQPLKVVPPHINNVKVPGFSLYVDQKYYYLTAQTKKDMLYSPSVGDYRISYTYLPVGTYVSIMGQQEGDTLKRYKERTLIVESGLLSAKNMLDAKKSSLAVKQYILRALMLTLLMISIILVT